MSWTHALWFASVNGLLVLGAAWLVAAVLPRAPSFRPLAAVLLACAAICLGLQAASPLRAIGPWTPAVVAAALFVAGAAARRAGRTRGAAIDDGAVASIVDGPPRLGPLATWIAASAAATAALVYADVVIRAWALPVEPVSDGPIYHLFFPLAWRQAGTLAWCPTPFGEQAACYFPADGSLLMLWLLQTWGDASPAKLLQVLFAFVAAAALADLVRALAHAASHPAAGGDEAEGAAASTSTAARRATWSAAGGFLLCPGVVISTTQPNVDLPFTAFALIAAAAAVRTAVGDLRLGTGFFLAGLAAGLAAGTKTIGLPLAPLLLAPLSVVYVASLRRATSSAVSKGPWWGAAAALLLAGLLLGGGFWYGRNWLATGNPVYPLHVGWGGETIFPGWYDGAAMRRSGYHLPVGDVVQGWAQLRAFFGLGWLAVVAVAIGAALPRIALALRRGGDRRPLVAGMLLAAALFWSAACWFAIPYNTQWRFLLPAVGLLLAAAGWNAAQCPSASSLALLAWISLSWLPGVRPGDLDGLAWSTAGRVVQSAAVLGQLAVAPAETRLLLWSFGCSGLAPALAAGIAGWLAWRRCRPPAGPWRAASPSGGRGRAPAAARIVAWLALLLVVVGAAVAKQAAWRLARNDVFYPRGGFAANLYPAWKAIDRVEASLRPEVAVRGRPFTVAYAGTNLPYYLFGPSGGRRVLHVPIRPEDAGPLHRFGRDVVALDADGRLTRSAQSKIGPPPLSDDPFPKAPRNVAEADGDACAAIWRGRLFEAGVDVLVVARENRHGWLAPGSFPAPFPVERDWAVASFDRVPIPDSPEPVWAEVYRLRPPR